MAAKAGCEDVSPGDQYVVGHFVKSAYAEQADPSDHANVPARAGVIIGLMMVLRRMVALFSLSAFSHRLPQRPRNGRFPALFNIFFLPCPMTLYPFQPVYVCVPWSRLLRYILFIVSLLHAIIPVHCSTSLIIISTILYTTTNRAHYLPSNVRGGPDISENYIKSYNR
jgi:hypothetical protein